MYIYRTDYHLTSRIKVILNLAMQNLFAIIQIFYSMCLSGQKVK